MKVLAESYAARAPDVWSPALGPWFCSSADTPGCMLESSKGFQEVQVPRLNWSPWKWDSALCLGPVQASLRTTTLENHPGAPSSCACALLSCNISFCCSFCV
jgi:hypothetical protein